jgi:hypothetical protein
MSMGLTNQFNKSVLKHGNTNSAISSNLGLVNGQNLELI